MQTVAKQEIRAFRPEDLEQVSAIEQASFKDPYPPYFLAQLARDNPHGFLVVTLNREIVGYGVIDQWQDHDHLISIAILPTHRRKGLGEKLLAELDATRKRERPLRLEVRQSNLAAISLYGKSGFKKIDTAEGYYTDGEDAIIMEKSSIKRVMVES